jgi:hypothetical protein
MNENESNECPLSILCLVCISVNVMCVLSVMYAPGVT